MQQKYETTAKVTISCDGDIVNIRDVIKTLENKQNGTLKSVVIKVKIDELNFDLVNSDFPDIYNAGVVAAI